MCQNSNVTPRVSVVIAVYKVEEYIAQCCHSLFAQTLENIEYIFVDDCSPDRSMDIVQSVLSEYPHRKDFVKIIRHQRNLGVSRTREDGVKAATGEYIIHCDPDDWVELDMYEQMYNKAIVEDADMVFCDVWWHYPDDQTPYYKSETPKELTGRSILASCFYAQQPIIHCSLWNKLIKSSLYHNVEWPNDIKYGEDMVVCVQILRLPIKLGNMAHAYYHYRLHRGGSLSDRNYVRADAERDLILVSSLYQSLVRTNDTELLYYWQAYCPQLMMDTLEAPRRVFTNKEYIARYKKYRKGIWKNRCLPFGKKAFLYMATYNYSITFFTYKAIKAIKARCRK